MVLPVTPWNSQFSTGGGITSAGFRWYETTTSRFGWKQAKPIDRTLPYSFDQVKILQQAHSNPTVIETSVNWDGSAVSGSLVNAAENQAYGRLVERLHGDQAELAVFLLELTKTSEMAAMRLIQLSKIVKAVKRRDLDSALKLLRINPIYTQRKTLKAAIKDIGSFWLETWWGWKPTIEDAHSLVEVLTKDPPLPRRKVYGMRTLTAAPVDTWNFVPTPLGITYTFTRTEQKARVKTGGFMQVENPNKVLAQDLGVINPLSWVWELTPWSAVVDWGLNVAQCINALSDFYGYTVHLGYTSVKKTLTKHYVALGYSSTFVANPPPGFVLQTTNWSTYSKRRTTFDRTPGIQGPHLQFWLPGKFSNYRLATAASLLTTFLR